MVVMNSQILFDPSPRFKVHLSPQEYLGAVGLNEFHIGAQRDRITLLVQDDYHTTQLVQKPDYSYEVISTDPDEFVFSDFGHYLQCSYISLLEGFYGAIDTGMGICLGSARHMWHFMSVSLLRDRGIIIEHDTYGVWETSRDDYIHELLTDYCMSRAGTNGLYFSSR